MTDSHPVFRLVWRLNAVVILGVGLVAGVVAAWALVQIGRDIVRPRVIDGVMRAPTAQAREVIALGGFTEAPGGRYLVGPITGEQDGDGGVYSKTIGSSRDLVVLDRETGGVTRVLDRLDHVILSWSYPVAERGADADPDPKHLVVTLVDADTDANGRLDGNDRRAVLVCAPSGRDCGRPITDVDAILSLASRVDGRVDIATTRAGKTEWRVINLDRTVTPAIEVFAVK